MPLATLLLMLKARGITLMPCYIAVYAYYTVSRRLFRRRCRHAMFDDYYAAAAADAALLSPCHDTSDSW